MYLCTSLEENRFTCKISHGFGLHCNVLSGHKRKGLTNKLQNVYTYALVWKKTGLLQVHRCFDMDLVCIIMYCQDTYNQLSQKK